ncbi:MAG: GNAT family N-acetyltransferase [Acetobacteraceae bacterium]
MIVSGLDNPFWASLHGPHRGLAMRRGDAARYPPAFAPFVGVPDSDMHVDAGLASLVAQDESVLLLGVAPRVTPAWQLEPLEVLAQMICEVPVPVTDGPEIIALDQSRRADVLALTALVYPHYFRSRTMEMGRYFGIYRDGRLAAMIGERLGTETHTEMSAICTHPDFAGRGYARRLTAFLTNGTLARGHTPFLHVSYGNPRAKLLYERIGYRLRRDIPLWALRRCERVTSPG